MNLSQELLNQKKLFHKGVSKNLDWRLKKLKLLANLIRDNEESIMQALEADLGKSAFEAYTTEIAYTLEELEYTIKHLARWTKPKRVRTALAQQLGKSMIYYEPYGQVLIISPWNYPFQLALTPLIAAIAAGNLVCLKMSRNAANTAGIVQKLLAKCFTREEVIFVDSQSISHDTLLAARYDYIFFTGSTTAGREVMQKAAPNLTPLTLELGGKSPCIVDRSANIDLAAKRIIWGKLLNAGQTCVAPDYVWVEAPVKAELIRAMRKYIVQFYGHDILNNPEYPKIINHKHFVRLSNLIRQQGLLISGGTGDERNLRIEPTIIDEVSWQDPIMQEEIFGPILPVLSFANLDEVISVLQTKEKPLALYLFSQNPEHEAQVINSLSFGGGAINDVILHLASPHLPFGGVGASGLGNYHGKSSFLCFSNEKSILKKSNLIDPAIRYAPFKDKLKIAKKFIGK